MFFLCVFCFVLGGGGCLLLLWWFLSSAYSNFDKSLNLLRINPWRRSGAIVFYWFTVFYLVTESCVLFGLLNYCVLFGLLSYCFIWFIELFY